MTAAPTAPTLAELLGPGGQYEIAAEDVLGMPLQVYKNRSHSMRDLIDARIEELGVGVNVRRS
jgi:hypothetical protein